MEITSGYVTLCMSCVTFDGGVTLEYSNVYWQLNLLCVTYVTIYYKLKYIMRTYTRIITVNICINSIATFTFKYINYTATTYNKTI